MKKIIATVLAMVMALALCTTAFAAIPVWSSNDSTANVDLFDGQYNAKVAEGTMKFYTAKAPVVKDGVLKTEGNIAYYVFEDATTHALTKYIMVNSIPADADASEYVLVKAHDDSVVTGVAGAEANQTGKDQALIMKEVSAVYYAQTASVNTVWGDLCGQYADPEDTDDVTYVAFNNALKVIGDEVSMVYSTMSTSTDSSIVWNVLVGNEVYTLLTAQTAKTHTWTASAWDKDGDATEYKCTTCKTVAKVINASVNAPAGSTVERIGDTLIAFTYTPAGTTAATGTATSPKTFDAGIAMYVGMALTSVAGSAVVIGKKKEF